MPSMMALNPVMQCWAWAISLRIQRSTEQDGGLPQCGQGVSRNLGEEACCCTSMKSVGSPTFSFSLQIHCVRTVAVALHASCPVFFFPKLLSE